MLLHNNRNLPAGPMQGELRLRQLWRIVALLMLLGANAPAWSEATATDQRFAVFYDGKRIGEHSWEIVRSGDTTRVSSRASFSFKLLFVPVYRYQHQANELWRHGCLVALASNTDDNGETYRVASSRPEGALQLTRSEPEHAVTPLDGDCPATFAYWDKQRLDRDTLINTQTGERAATRLIREGVETVNGVESVRYRLEVDQAPSITLWYRRGDDQWLGLETRRDGSKLEYRLELSETRQVPSPGSDSGVEMPSAG
jgi:hypothetical protein